MKNSETKKIMALIFTFISGYVDVLGLLALGGMFLSFMSGNSTHLGIQIAKGDFASALPFIVIILSFISGVIIGEFLKEKREGNLLVTILICEVGLLLLSLFFYSLEIEWLVYAPLTIAMGLQNSGQVEINNVIIGKSFLSGTLYALGVSLSRLLQKREQRFATFLLFVSWFLSVMGSITGALIFYKVGLKVTLIILISFLLILLALNTLQYIRSLKRAVR